MEKIRKEEFIKLHKILPVNELAKKLKCSRVTIRNWARKFDLPLKSKSIIKD